ncbi:MAG TPA: signal peptidase II [Phycisphaerae bacterium]|nr:signal peptidase II [Phycisphaerae bacterium]
MISDPGGEAAMPQDLPKNVDPGEDGGGTHNQDARPGNRWQQAGGGRAWLSAASWARFLAPAILGLALDLSVKSWAFPQGVTGKVLNIDGQTFDIVGRNPLWFQTDFGTLENPPTTLIPHVLGLHTTINHGAVFGIWQGMVFYFLLFSIAAMAVILWVFAGSKKDQWVVHIALGLITAGALGNLYDRAAFNGVRDMFQFYVHWYPYIFNVADVLLCIGVPLLMLRWSLGKSRPPGGIGPGQWK